MAKVEKVLANFSLDASVVDDLTKYKEQSGVCKSVLVNRLLKHYLLQNLTVPIDTTEEA